MAKKPLLTGFAASKGVAEGKVRIILDPSKTSDFKEGEILVARVTEPSMILAMNRAAAFVTDVGGITSHAAIIAREIGVPCVSNTITATQILKNGMRVRVDGTQGKVFAV